MTKINVDVFFKLDIAAVCVVARSHGDEVRWLWRSKVLASSPLEAEMKGVFLAMLIAKFRGVKNVILEGDNMSIMDGLRVSNQCPVRFLLPLFLDILEL